MSVQVLHTVSILSKPAFSASAMLLALMATPRKSSMSWIWAAPQHVHPGTSASSMPRALQVFSVDTFSSPAADSSVHPGKNA